MRGNVNPLPPYVRRVSNSNIQYGGALDSVVVWPSANPSIVAEPGEQLSLSLRLRPRTGGHSFDLELAAGAPSFCRLRREARGGGFLLDIALQAPQESTSYTIPLRIAGGSPEAVSLTLDLKVPTENLVVTPRELDFGEVSLKEISGGRSLSKRVGVRKQAGSFQITSVSSTLPFLTFERQTIIEGRNYVVRVTIAGDKLSAAGTYTGSLQIATGERVCEVPVRVKVTK